MLPWSAEREINDKKKKYLTILTTTIIAQIPVIIASIISLLGYISTQARMVTSSISGFCSVISTVLVYFAIKALHSENDDDKVTKTFIITMAIYYGIALILKFFTIYI